jgi:hypothetical protein
VIDFLLIGGFNLPGQEKHDRQVVSGIFFERTNTSASYHMLIENPDFTLPNRDWAIYYPPIDYALGDCCAEHVFWAVEGNNGNIIRVDRDEIICFGGRANQSDTALAHDTPATLEFNLNPNNHSARWNYEKYPRMPHPRWSAASVLIKDLVRKGETVPCDRIFIIGGRNREGFVAEVDVFNLRYNDWETDWPGLDEGELETVPASMGGSGATIIINNQGGGSSGLQSVRAGRGIEVTGDNRNPTVAATGSIWEAM